MATPQGWGQNDEVLAFGAGDEPIAEEPQSVIKPLEPPHGFAEGVSRWTDNVAHDLKYGTDLTGIGTVLKKMGAHGLNVGASEKVGEFMGSLPLGLLRFVKGHSELASGHPIQGIQDIAGGAMQATEMPSLVAGPPGAPAVGRAAGSTIARGLKATGELIPSAERAGQKFEQVAAAVGKQPVDLSKASEPIFKALELQETGGGAPPQVITKLAERLPQHGGRGATFEESRLFQSNAGRLSTAEQMAAKPQMHRQVSLLAKALAEENERVAEAGGVGDVYREAMKEYRNYKRLEDFKGKALKYAERAAAAALLGGAAAEGYHFFRGE